MIRFAVPGVSGVESAARRGFAMTAADTTDHQLLHAWTADGDARAFTEIVKRHGRMVLGVCRRIVGDASLAEDLAQDCFVRLVELRDAPHRNLAGWLHRVATHSAVSALRARRLRDGTGRSLEPSDPDGPDRHAALRELQDRVDEVIAELPDKLRQAVVGHFLLARTQVELAREYGVAERTVAYRIRRGVEEVRLRLARRGIEIEPAALATALLALPAPAALAPHWLAGLGKLGLAGPTATGTAGAVAWSGLAVAGSAKSTVIAGVAVALLAVLGAWLAWRPESMGSPEPGRAAPEVAAAPADRNTTAAAPVREPVADQGGEAAPVDTDDRVPLEGPMLEGLVVDAAGTPLPGARVILAELPARSDEPWIQVGGPPTPEVHTTRSGPDGRFALQRAETATRGWICASLSGYAMDRHHLQAGAATDLVLEMHPGRNLEGRLLDGDGRPLPNVLLTTDQCWRESDFAEHSSGIALTDERGTFAIGIDPEAVACTLGAESPDHGHDVFVGVPTAGFAELRWNDRAVVEGQVAGMTAEQVGRVQVDVTGSLADPPIPVWRSGWNMLTRFSAEVDADGRYRVEGIQPGMTYDACLVEVPTGTTTSRGRLRLSPDGLERFPLSAGEVVTRDFALQPPIVVTGRVLTAQSRQPLAGIRIAASKDGVTLHDVYAETDGDGRYEVRLTAGPGTYRLQAEPRWTLAQQKGDSSGIDRLLDASQPHAIDLVLPEPTILGFRVLDLAGKPIESVRTSLSVESSDGRRASWGDSQRLDAEGRGSLRLFEPLARLRFHVSPFPDGPGAVQVLEDITPGVEVPELTFTLPPACDLAAGLVDADGIPLAATSVHVTAHYADGSQESTNATTDALGRLLLAGRMRANSTARLRLSAQDAGSATSELAATLPDGTADLGVVTLGK